MSMLITFSQRHCTPVYHRGAQTTVRWCFVGSGNSLVLQSRKSFKLIFMLMCFFKCTGLELMAATGAGSSNCFNAERDLILKWLTFWDEISPQQKIHSSFLYIQGDFLNCPPPYSITKWKNEPAGAAVSWNPLSGRASGWLFSLFHFDTEQGRSS